MPLNPPFAVIIYTIQFTSFVRIAAGLYTFGTLIDLVCLHKSSNYKVCTHQPLTRQLFILSIHLFYCFAAILFETEDYERFDLICMLKCG